jgi:cell wall-associated NlpC family hydrolase
VRADSLVPRAAAALVMVTARVAPVFAAADIKAPVVLELPFGARVAGAAGERFFACAAGFIHNRHLAAAPATPIEVARLFTGAPYLWGGRTPLGVDCSGLVQAALAACGIAAPRDSDQQLGGLGVAADFEARDAGDLVFFPGHVGILATRDRLLHANAHWMATVEEPLADVIARLHAAGVAEPVTGVRRV